MAGRPPLREDAARPHDSAPHSAGFDQAGSHQAGSDQAGQDRSDEDHTGADRTVLSHPRDSFPPEARVRAKAEFGRVFEHGRRFAMPLLTLHYLLDDRPARLGLAVSRKVDGRAVVRNRIKRRLRDYFRRRRAVLAGGAYVVVARPPAAAATGTELLAAFERALLRAGALPTKAAPCTMPPASPSTTFAPTSPDAASSSTPAVDD
jgi:ribonuclease P protein component